MIVLKDMENHNHLSLLKYFMSQMFTIYHNKERFYLIRLVPLIF